MSGVKGSRSKRAAIIDVAKRHFFEHGYSGANLDRIAAEAAVSKVTIYSHFGSKEDLFLHVMGEVIERLSESGPPPRVDCPEQLQAHLRRTARTLIATVTHPDVVGMRRVLTAEQPRHPALAARWRATTVDATVAELAHMFDGAHPQLTKATSRDLASQFLWMTIGDPLDAALMSGPSQFMQSRHVDAAVRTIMTTVRSLIAE